MATQAELRKQLTELDTTIAKLKTRLAAAEKNKNRNPAAYNSIKAQLDEAEKTKTQVQANLNNLTTASGYTAATAERVNESIQTQASLQAQLERLDANIAATEKELKATNPNNNPSKYQILQGQLQRDKNERAKVQNQLNKLTVVPPEQDPRSRGLNRATVPAASPTGTTDSTKGLEGQVTNARKQQTAREQFEPQINTDWRFKIYLAPNSKYLYNDPTNILLSPLNGVGVIFPYTPTVAVSYIANYDPQNVTHSNYKLYFYKDSAVENISITGEFTAQNTEEANYLLAVIHFFKSATKMFYGQDQNPVNGTPPPICYIDGFGSYQFNKHPILINNFTYSFPNDVDYIKASYPPPLVKATNEYPEKQNERNLNSTDRLIGVKPGGVQNPPQFARQASGVPTYVPTKIQITLTAYPVVSRRDISSNFSVKDYANGQLLLGKENKYIGAGIW